MNYRERKEKAAYIAIPTIRQLAQMFDVDVSGLADCVADIIYEKDYLQVRTGDEISHRATAESVVAAPQNTAMPSVNDEGDAKAPEKRRTKAETEPRRYHDNYNWVDTGIRLNERKVFKGGNGALALEEDHSYLRELTDKEKEAGQIALLVKELSESVNAENQACG